jgi:hypothetical protein
MIYLFDFKDFPWNHKKGPSSFYFSSLFLCRIRDEKCSDPEWENVRLTLPGHINQILLKNRIRMALYDNDSDSILSKANSYRYCSHGTYRTTGYLTIKKPFFLLYRIFYLFLPSVNRGEERGGETKGFAIKFDTQQTFFSILTCQTSYLQCWQRC